MESSVGEAIPNPDFMLAQVWMYWEYNTSTCFMYVHRKGVSPIGISILSQTKDGGIVSSCGNAAGIKLNTTVMPFIIRGVKLWGINSVTASIKRRQFLWNEVSKLIDFELLEKSVKEIGLEDLNDVYVKMLKGETSGRHIINLSK